MSYKKILQLDLDEYNSCPFHWNCENCSKSLCLRITGIAELPSAYGHFKIIAFQNNKDKKDHIAVVKGKIMEGEDILTRLHSSCLTGDALGSMRCDCGPQLETSLYLIEKEGRGVLLYMQQEGRGIGLANKIRAYMLQDGGLDTYDANVHLGFQPDERDYELSAAMLKKLNVSSVLLLTNNPEKIKELERFSIRVRGRVPLEIKPNEFDRFYLETKKKKFGHMLSLT
jgi:GTP cyclohydrolase II